MHKVTRRKFVASAAALAGGIGAAGVVFLTTRKKPSDVRIEQVSYRYEEHAFRAPFRFARAVVDRQTMLTVECTVRTASGKVASGFGILPLNYTFSFPSERLSAAARLGAMKALAEVIAKVKWGEKESATPHGANWYRTH